MDDNPARTLVVVNFPMLRRGIAALVAEKFWLSVCGEASDAAQARELCATLQPDLIMLDLELGDGDGLLLMRELAQLCPKAQILALGEREDVSWLQCCFRAGAVGYLSKHDAVSTWESQLWWLFQGDRLVSQRLSHSIVEQITSGRPISAVVRTETLSNRELAVLRSIGNGKGPSAIARGFGVSVKTIETYQQRIKTKLSLRSGEELKRHAADWVLSKS